MLKPAVIITPSRVIAGAKTESTFLHYPVLGDPLFVHILHSVSDVEAIWCGLQVSGNTYLPKIVTDTAKTHQIDIFDKFDRLEDQALATATDFLILSSDFPFLSKDSINQLINLYDTADRSINLAAIDPSTNNIAALMVDSRFLLAESGFSKYDSLSFGEAVEQFNSSKHPKRFISLIDPIETIQIQSLNDVVRAEQSLQHRVNQSWIENGVLITDPASIRIGLSVRIGPETIILPNTFIYGNTVVGKACHLGPNTFIQTARLGNSTKVRFSVIEHATVENNVDIGPFAHLRKGAHLADNVHMGNFGEVKNSYLGPGTKMGHFSYLGDATIGQNVNIGAGTITCNYDGINKNPTKIGDNSFIGSDTMLVAPVTLGNNSRTGAGSVVTNDVADDSLVYGVPARPSGRHKDAAAPTDS